MITLQEHDFTDAETLAQTLALDVANVLRTAIASRGQALVALSGGNTPRRFLELLGRQSLDWTRTKITLADERWVPAQDPRSNEHLLRETLLHGAAEAAHFVPLYTDAATPEQGCAQISADVAKLHLPFDAVLLGMGADGHCASLFPDGDRLADALRPDSDVRVMPMRAPSAGEPRMTLTLAALINTRSLYLHFEGAEKDAAFARAMFADETATAQAPIRTVLQHSPVTPKLFRCR